MAGSIQWFAYTADDGVTYAVKLDKSNANALGFSAATANLKPLPKLWQMRRVNCVLAGTGEGVGFYRRSFPVGTLTAAAWTSTATLTIAGKTWQPVSTTGEKKVNAFVVDTGLTDG